MSNKQNTCSSVAAPEQAMEKAAFSGATNFQLNYNIPPGSIASFLMDGQHNAITLKQLTKITGYNERAIRAQIASERLRGIPIISDNQNGYFLPANEYDKNRVVKSMRHRAREIQKVATAVDRCGKDNGSATVLLHTRLRILQSILPWLT